MEQAQTRFVVITGLSGAGKRAAGHVLEDLGWYLVDNLPPSMLFELLRTVSARGVDKVVVILDVRTRAEFDEIPAAFTRLRAAGVRPELLYLDCTEEALVTRQESVRRPHPLQGDGPLLDGIRREREMLATLRGQADMIIDTTNINVRQLAKRVIGQFNLAQDAHLRLSLLSFGFKHGVPVDADVVFDVRFLPNPHWVPELRPLTGLQPEVSAYVLGQENAEPWLEAAEAMLAVMAPGYEGEGKRQATIAIGCTGGKHRSTAMATELTRRLVARGLDAHALHRDLGKE